MKQQKQKMNLLIIFFIIISIIVIIFNCFPSKKRDNFDNRVENFTSYNNSNLYDNFYSNIYDKLVYSKFKNSFEVGQIINSTKPNEHSYILDIGSGTGHHVNLFQEKNIQVIGLDNSEEMIQFAQKKYPRGNFMKGDMMNSLTFSPETFTHIVCFYFTIYYTKDKDLFFQNCFRWLKPGGYCIVHLVNRDMFDPMLSNPLMYVSPQRYAKSRLTQSKLIFDNLTYKSNFEYKPEENLAIFHEKFIKNKEVRKNEHTLYMEPLENIVQIAQNNGFITHGIIDLVSCSFEYQYLYVFVKPN